MVAFKCRMGNVYLKAIRFFFTVNNQRMGVVRDASVHMLWELMENAIDIRTKVAESMMSMEYVFFVMPIM